MGDQTSAGEGDILSLARRLIPADGNDWAAVARGGEAEKDFLARVGPLLHEDFVTVWPGEGSETSVTSGLEATLAGLRAIGRAFESLVAIPELYVELGDRVLVLLYREGRTIDGIDFREEGAALYVFETGLLCRMRLYSDRATAVRDNGLTAAEAAERGSPSSA